MNRSKLKMKVKGKVGIVVRDAKTGKVLERHQYKNLFTTAGLTQLLKLLIGESSGHIDYCGVGSGATEPALGDTALQTQIGRIALSSYSRTALVATLTFYFGSGDCNGTWVEEGLFSMSSGGTMFCHTHFDATITKNTSKTITVTHQITFAFG